MKLEHQNSDPITLFHFLIVIFLNWMAIGLVYPIFFSILFQEGEGFLGPDISSHVRGFYLGLLLSSMSMAKFFSSPILGSLSDQKGRRPLLLYSIGFSFVSQIICFLAVWIGSLFTLILGRILVGLAAGNVAVFTAIIADLSSRDNKGRNFGLYNMASGLGFIVGPFLGGWLALVGFSLPFFSCIVVTLLNFIYILFFFPETNGSHSIREIRMGEGIRNLKKAFKIPSLKRLFWVVLFFSMSWSFFYEFLPVIWIGEYGFNSGQIGFFYSYGAICYAFSSGYLIRLFVDRYQHSKVLFAALVSLGSLFILLLFGPSANSIWIYLPIANFLCAIITPTANAIVSDLADKKAQGETLGISQSVQAAAFGLSPLVAGAFLGVSSDTPIVLATTSMLVAWVILKIPLKSSSP